MTKLQDNFPPVVEQIVITEEEQLSLERILSKFQQLVPSNLVPLATKERNYMCSTAGWKEPVCERYMFFHQEQPVQLDVPLVLIEKLGLELGQDIPYPVYILPSVLKREPEIGAITIEQEQEIFLQKPLTSENLERELTKLLEKIEILWEQIKTLSSRPTQDQLTQAQNKIKELEKEKTQLTNQREQLNRDKDDLTAQINNLTNQLNALSLRPTQEQLTQAQNRIRDLENERTQLVSQRDTANNLIANTQTKLNINNLNLLPHLPTNETPTTLLQRPTQAQFQERQNQINQLNNQIISLNQQLVNANNEENRLRLSGLTSQEKVWINALYAALGGHAYHNESYLPTLQQHITTLQNQTNSIGNLQGLRMIVPQTLVTTLQNIYNGYHAMKVQRDNLQSQVNSLNLQLSTENQQHTATQASLENQLSSLLSRDVSAYSFLSKNYSRSNYSFNQKLFEELARTNFYSLNSGYRITSVGTFFIEDSSDSESHGKLRLLPFSDCSSCLWPSKRVSLSRFSLEDDCDPTNARILLGNVLDFIFEKAKNN